MTELNFKEYRRGLMDAFHVANMINANRQGRTAEETCSYIVRSLAEAANGYNASLPAPQPDSAPQDSGERTAFEAAWASEYPSHRPTAFKRRDLNPDAYVNTHVQDGWLMWQAALAQKAVPIAVRPRCKICADQRCAGCSIG